MQRIGYMWIYTLGTRLYTTRKLARSFVVEAGESKWMRIIRMVDADDHPSIYSSHLPTCSRHLSLEVSHPPAVATHLHQPTYMYM